MKEKVIKKIVKRNGIEKWKKCNLKIIGNEESMDRKKSLMKKILGLRKYEEEKKKKEIGFKEKRKILEKSKVRRNI